MDSNRGIDAHNHMLPVDYLDFVKKGHMENLAEFEETGEGRFLLFPGPERGRKIRIPVLEELYNWDIRAQDMEKMGLSQALISHTPFTFHYGGEAEQVRDIHMLLNDALAANISSSEAYRGLANVPLQSVDLAIAEMERAITELGFVGVQLGSNVSGKYLGDKSFWPFFEAAEALGAFVLIHPIDVAGFSRLQNYYFRNLIGNPLDTTICAGSLIYAGLLEKFPNLKICLSHGGGMLPILHGRWDHGYHVRPECRHLDNLPSSYLKGFYYDIITHSGKILEYLIRTVGPERVVIGTDYPFDMGLSNPMEVINEINLDERTQNLITYDNMSIFFF